MGIFKTFFLVRPPDSHDSTCTSRFLLSKTTARHAERCPRLLVSEVQNTLKCVHVVEGRERTNKFHMSCYLVSRYTPASLHNTLISRQTLRINHAAQTHVKGSDPFEFPDHRQTPHEFKGHSSPGHGGVILIFWNTGRHAPFLQKEKLGFGSYTVMKCKCKK
jgi:hypothetical protein